MSDCSSLGDIIAFCPPPIIPEAQIDELLDGFGKASDDGRDLALREGWLAHAAE